eukprot:m.150978 g.150978  ORF g.150978 m.150978 type:complete len:332 (-) comp30751_c1_seq5:718-1713(-)
MAQKGEKPLGVKMSISSWPISTDQKVEQPISISSWPPPRSQPTSSLTAGLKTVVPTSSHESKRRKVEEPRSTRGHLQDEAQLVLPLTFLAKHVRKHGYGNSYTHNRATTTAMEGASSTTRLYAFARSSTGQQLLQDQRTSLERALVTSNDGADCRTILAAYLMQLNEPAKALVLLNAAVDGVDPHPDATWLREIAKRQTEVKTLQLSFSESFVQLKMGNVKKAVTQVERRSAKTLTTDGTHIQTCSRDGDGDGDSDSNNTHTRGNQRRENERTRILQKIFHNVRTSTSSCDYHRRGGGCTALEYLESCKRDRRHTCDSETKRRSVDRVGGA